MSAKDIARAQVRKLLKELDQSRVTELSNKISENLLDYLVQNFPNFQDLVVGVYAPIKNEVISHLAFGEKLVTAFPALDGDEMIFKRSRFEDLVASKEFGTTILAPQKECQKVSPDILIIPGLAFNVEGKRLGRGKGYYDRYLANFKGTRVGICYEFQILEEIPSDEHDQLMDIVLTELNRYQN